MTINDALKLNLISRQDFMDSYERLSIRESGEIVLACYEDQHLSPKGYYLTDDERATHTHILGSTGGGKSKLMEFMIRQDILRGKGVCLIDPHGELYYDILTYIVSTCDKEKDKDILDKIVLIEPTAPTYLPAFNPFKKSEGVDTSVHASNLVKILEKVWGKSFNETAGLRKILYYAFYTAAERELSLFDIAELLNPDSPRARRNLIETLNHFPLPDRSIQDFWINLVTHPKKEEAPLTGAFNRIIALTSIDRLVMMSIQGKSLDFRKIIDSNGILLVNLAKGNKFDEESTRILGAMIISELSRVFRARSEMFRLKSDPRNAPEWRDHPFYLYIDEFHEYATADLNELLSGGRKFGIHLVLANQTFSQLDSLDDKIRGNVLDNTKTKAYFPISGYEDAEMIAKQMFRYSPQIKDRIERIQSLPDGYMIAEASGRSYSLGGDPDTDRYSKGERHLARNRLHSTTENVYYSETEVARMQANQIQHMSPRVFLFQSPRQPDAVTLKTEWIFDTLCYIEDIEAFESYMVEHTEIYEEISQLKKHLSFLRNPDFRPKPMPEPPRDTPDENDPFA